MNVYSILAIIVRLFVAFQLWGEGRRALTGQTRTFGNTVMLLSAASLFLGFFTYLFTLILLVYLGVKIWKNRQKGVKLGLDPILFILTLLLFLKGPGAISLDKLVGNI